MRLALVALLVLAACAPAGELIQGPSEPAPVAEPVVAAPEPAPSEPAAEPAAPEPAAPATPVAMRERACTEACTDVFTQGQERVFVVDGREYLVRLLYAVPGQARFVVDGEAYDPLTPGLGSVYRSRLGLRLDGVACEERCSAAFTVQSAAGCGDGLCERGELGWCAADCRIQKCGTACQERFVPGRTEQFWMKDTLYSVTVREVEMGVAIVRVNDEETGPLEKGDSEDLFQGVNVEHVLHACGGACTYEVRITYTSPCGDGVCHEAENAGECPGDCPPVCPDGYCTHGEDAESCNEDCPIRCGDGLCTWPEGFTTECPEDCG